MYLYRDDTLAYFKASALLAPQDFSHVSSKTVGQSAKAWVMPQFCKTAEMSHAEAEAINFYALNHVFAEMHKRYSPHEIMHPKDVELCALYLSKLSEIGRRLFYYILLISTRESRHLYNKETFKTKLKKEFGEGFVDFHSNIKGEDSLSVAKIFMTNPPNVTIGNFLAGLTYVFNNGGFSGGYGGKPWGNISHTAETYVKGETSLEIMTDTAFTLAHNNGTMFNKGMLYKDASKSELRTILDVQRSGQIPQLIHSIAVGDVNLSLAGVPLFWPSVLERFPEFTTHVDWFKVEALGSIGKYSSYKQMQTNKYGSPKKSKEEVEAEKKAKAEALKLANSKLWITPHEYIYKVERKKAA